MYTPLFGIIAFVVLLFILPVLQKITFALFFVWAAWINVSINMKYEVENMK
jgi:hypothetical protein